MTPRNRTLALGLIFALAVISAFVTRTYGTIETVHPRAEAMQAAQQLASQWMQKIGEFKTVRGIPSLEGAPAGTGAMLGDEFNTMTTTMGSLEAKVAASNPAFAALMVRLLCDAGIDSSSVVGVTMSASFPSLAVATLAALQTLGCDAVVISSLGASMYGANQPQATWLDMEKHLREQGGLRYRSSLVTPGADGDRGDGLLDEGLAAISEAAHRTGYELFSPTDLRVSVGRKMRLLVDRKVDLLVNIGGNQASIGACVHAVGIPNGYHDHYPGCTCPDRGIIARLAERGVPFIHLLNIRDLAARYSLKMEPGAHGLDVDRMWVTRRTQPAMVVGSLLLVSLALAAYGRTKNGRKSPTT